MFRQNDYITETDRQMGEEYMKTIRRLTEAIERLVAAVEENNRLLGPRCFSGEEAGQEITVPISGHSVDSLSLWNRMNAN